MLETVTKTITDYQLIEPGQSVLVGLSGGPDSVALLHILTRLPQKVNAAAVYVNHQIRPRTAKKEEQFCRTLCSKLNVRFFVEEANVPELARQSGKGLEETGRDVRYRVFEQLVRKHGFEKVALAHHIDDRVETVLFHILRGCGLAGLSGMPIKRGNIVRPLYQVSKADILIYLKAHNLSYCIDRSNLGEDRTRSFMRNNLLPSIRSRINQRVDSAIISLSETASEDERFLEQLVDRSYRRSVKTSAGGKLELDLTRFAGYNLWLRRRLLRRCLAEASCAGQAPDRATVEQLLDLVKRKARACSLPNRVEAIIVGDRLVLYRRGNILYEIELQPGRRTELAQLRLTLKCWISSLSTDVPRQRRAAVVVLDRSGVVFPLLVRNIRRGDRFQPLGMSGRKKVGDYLTDRKTDRVYRDEIPVVCDSNGIIWLVGYEIADRVKIGPATKEVVTIEVSRRRKSAANSF